MSHTKIATATSMITRTPLVFPCLFLSSFAFVGKPQQQQHYFHSTTPERLHPKQLHLIPLSNFDDSISFFSEPDSYRCCIDEKGFFPASNDNNNNDSNEKLSSPFQLGVLQEDELPDLCRFVVSAFGAEAISLSSDMTSFEKALMNPAAELLNGYSSLVAFAEVFSGTKQRVADRLNDDPSLVTIAPPNLSGLTYKEKIRKAECNSLVLLLARKDSDNDNNTDNRGSSQVIASIELRLQPCDAKIPFSIPWLDRVERKLGSVVLGLGRNENDDTTQNNNNNLQPYLSNLCVDEEYRGQKIGRGLVRCVENIAKTNWGYKRMYLHVDEDNPAALNLYKSEGYRDVGHRWNPFWSGGASEIGYYVKTL